MATEIHTEITICIYCNAECSHGDLVPEVSDDAAWDALSREHGSDCEWILTRAHRVDAPEDYVVDVLSSDETETVLSVTIAEHCAPWVLSDDGEWERDYGNAWWPSDKEIASFASGILQRDCYVEYCDIGSSLIEGIYSCRHKHT